MLPSSGAFREIDCPHHDAICGRPYCHFRHRSKKKAIHSIDSVEDSADNSNSSNDVPTYNPTPKSQLASARGHLPISYVPDLVIRTDRSSSRPPITMPKIEYKPTPKSILSSTTKANRSEYVPSPVRKDKINIVPTEIANAVDNIDLEDLDTEFGLIDEILSDGSFIEEKNSSKEVLDKKVEEVTKKSSTSSKSSNKGSKNSKERHSKDKSSTSSKSRRKERDKDKDKSSISTKDNKDSKDKDAKEKKIRDKKNVKSNKDAKDNKDVRDKKTVSKSDKTSKHQSKSVSTSKSKHKTSSNSKIKDKDHKSSKDKHKSAKSGHESSKSSINTKSKNSSISSKNTPEENLHNLLDSNDSTDVNIDYSNIDLDIEEEDDDPTLEEECYRIFNEYKPTPIVELEKNPPVDEKYVPEDIATIGKKRIAYENAEKMTTNKLPPLADRNKPVVPSPAQTMLNRIKQARMAQSNNEQNNIMTELKRQQEELHFKRNKETSAAENVSLVRAKIDRRNSTEQNITSDLMRQYEELKLKRSRESSAEDLKKNKIAKTGIGANCNLNGRDLIVASKIKNRIAHQSTDLIDDILNGRSKPRKIAPVLNVNSIQKAKERVEQLKTLTQPPKTSAQTSFKTPRVAHVPDYSLSELPDVTHALKSKLAVNVRTRYLTMFADETVKLYLSRDDAYNRAVGEEDKCYERCSALPTYRNCAMLSISRLRKEVKERVASGLGPLESGEEDREEADDQGLGGERLYGLLDKYRMGEEELELHGFPMASPEPGRAQIKLKPNSACSLPSNQRICARCKKVYLIDKKGFPQYEEECIYHPLKKRTLRGDRAYLCCKSPDDAGCVTSNTHVSEVAEDRVLLGYQITLPPSTTSDPRSHAIYALDCEMCYTTIGLELTRVTIVDPQMKTVYESLVKPLNQILDYNTQFSGITHDQMERTSTNILQVQANILHLCNSNTILIGHSLESDLKALKIIHSSVVDTSVMFPHKFGLPHKRALKALASDFLRKIIQNSVSGHDSAEDALTSMELVLWKVKEDLKVKGISASSLMKKR